MGSRPQNRLEERIEARHLIHSRSCDMCIGAESWLRYLRQICIRSERRRQGWHVLFDGPVPADKRRDRCQGSCTLYLLERHNKDGRPSLRPRLDDFQCLNLTRRQPQVRTYFSSDELGMLFFRTAFWHLLDGTRAWSCLRSWLLASCLGNFRQNVPGSKKSCLSGWPLPRRLPRSLAVRFPEHVPGNEILIAARPFRLFPSVPSLASSASLGAEPSSDSGLAAITASRAPGTSAPSS